jgi:hypothetical protein
MTVIPERSTTVAPAGVSNPGRMLAIFFPFMIIDTFSRNIRDFPSNIRPALMQITGSCASTIRTEMHERRNRSNVLRKI